MALQSGIEDLFHLAMPGEEVGHHAAARVVLFHAHGQRLGAAQHQPALEGRQDRARGFLNERQLLRLLPGGADQHASKAVAVSVEELRGRVHYDVGAKLDGCWKYGDMKVLSTTTSQ